MKSDKRKYWQEKLKVERESILQILSKLNDEERMSLKEATGELSSYDNHPADQASNTFERSKDIGLRDDAAETLEKIDRALQLIEDEEYGSCQNCGQEINSERLNALPYSIYCKNCAEIEER